MSRSSFDKELHNSKLMGILLDIYKDDDLAGKLIFKGGTCLMLFYELNCVSVDLDFDLRSGIDEIDEEKIKDIMRHNGLEILEKPSKNKFFGYAFVGRYGIGNRHIKIDISKRQRDYEDHIDPKDYYGQTIFAMAPDDMFANKLLAILERNASRDLFDADFMFRLGWKPREEVIRARSDIDIMRCYKKILKLINDKERDIDPLYDLGEFLLDVKQKAWVRDKLVDSLKTQLRVRIGK